MRWIVLCFFWTYINSIGFLFAGDTEEEASSSLASDVQIENRKLRIAHIEIREKMDVVGLCVSHASSKESSFLDLNFSEIWGMVTGFSFLQEKQLLDDIFGIYGFHLDDGNGEKLVGVICMMMGHHFPGVPTNGYAECQMLMHPDYRGKGLGKLFRGKFNEEIVIPKAGSVIRTAADKEGIFRGAKGYIHVDNFASRKVLTATGYQPADLSYTDYQGDKNKTAQIIYVYPPLEKNLLSSFPGLLEVILKNHPDDNDRIIGDAKKIQKVREKMEGFFKK